MCHLHNHFFQEAHVTFKLSFAVSWRWFKRKEGTALRETLLKDVNERVWLCRLESPRAFRSNENSAQTPSSSYRVRDRSSLDANADADLGTPLLAGSQSSQHDAENEQTSQTEAHNLNGKGGSRQACAPPSLTRDFLFLAHVEWLLQGHYCLHAYWPTSNFQMLLLYLHVLLLSDLGNIRSLASQCSLLGASQQKTRPVRKLCHAEQRRRPQLLLPWHPPCIMAARLKSLTTCQMAWRLSSIPKALWKTQIKTMLMRWFSRVQNRRQAQKNRVCDWRQLQSVF